MGNYRLHTSPWIIVVKYIGFEVSFGTNRRYLLIAMGSAPWLLDNVVIHVSCFKDSGFQDT